MEHKIDPQKALSVFDKITKYGDKHDEEYRFNGLTASQSFDGYSVTIADNKVSLTINFHNTFHLDAPNNLALEDFIERMDKIHKAVVG